MKLGLIPPNSLISYIERTDFTLVVPDQLKDARTAAFINPLQNYKVLDNGAAERDIKPLNWLDARCSSGAFHEVVAIDRLRDPNFSIDGARSMAGFKQRYPDIKIMAVVQATSPASMMKTIGAYTLMPHIDVIGLPRVLNEQFGARTRVALCESLAKDGSFPKPIHCLGAFYDFPDEARYLASQPNVRSMDSSLPFVLGLYGLRFTDKLPQGLRRPTDYFNIVPDDLQMGAIDDNVDAYINWATS